MDVKLMRTADDLMQMTGWVDHTQTQHPGDGVPRIQNTARGWKLWFTTEHEGKKVLTNRLIPHASRDLPYEAVRATLLETYEKVTGK